MTPPGVTFAVDRFDQGVLAWASFRMRTCRRLKKCDEVEKRQKNQNAVETKKRLLNSMAACLTRVNLEGDVEGEEIPVEQSREVGFGVLNCDLGSAVEMSG